MNSKIKSLLNDLETENKNIGAIQEKLQREYNKVFNDSKELSKVIANAKQSSKYQFGNYGEIQSWFRFSGLSDYADASEYFETWLSETHNMQVDWANDCLLNNQGESLIIQFDTRHDNGVWLNGKCIINESEYKLDGDVDTDKRNVLIEEYMTRTGYFPGVFKANSYGNVFLVNTQARKK